MQGFIFSYRFYCISNSTKFDQFVFCSSRTNLCSGTKSSSWSILIVFWNCVISLELFFWQWFLNDFLSWFVFIQWKRKMGLPELIFLEILFCRLNFAIYAVNVLNYLSQCTWREKSMSIASVPAGILFFF